MSQCWNADHYARDAGFVAVLGEPLLEWLAPQPGEQILDLGCGDGVLTARLVAAGAEVRGLDSSPELASSARDKGLTVDCLDAAEMTYENRFDAVFSNAAMHWMPDLPRVLARIRAALRPGGRLVAEMGGSGNVFQVRQALCAELHARGLDSADFDPWIFPGCVQIERWLRESGLQPQRCERFARPTQLPGDLSAWLEVFAGSFLRALSTADRQAVIEAVTDRLRPRLWRPQHGWVLDYVRLRFAALKAGC